MAMHSDHGKSPRNRAFLQNPLELGIPAKEIAYSDLISIIYRAQQSRQFYVERLIDISQQNSCGGGEWL